ncbi:MAG: hypothetical protein ACYDH6_22510 [Acidimicrobiales bacterium]
MTEDLGIPMPNLDIDLGRDLDHPLIDELRRIAATSPTGQKRVLSIDHPLVYRIRVSRHRGATWVDEEPSIVWLCAARLREDGSAGDAFAWFAALHAKAELLPAADDRLRDRAEAAIRLQRGLTAELLRLFDTATIDKGTEHHAELGGWLACRMLVTGEELEEIWCALSVRATDQTGVNPALRDLLFAALDRYVAPAVFEVRNDWRDEPAQWFEVVRLGIR